MNKKELSEVAEKLERLLQQYAVTNRHAREVYNSCKPLLEKAKLGSIEEPVPGGWFHVYLEPGYALSEINDLSQAAAEFSVLLKGWDSLEDFRSEFAKMEEKALQEEAEIRKKTKD